MSSCTRTYTKPTPRFDINDKNAVYKLNSGYDMPVIAYGTFRNTSTDDDVIINSILDAIRTGYRHFDLAHIYGNEKQIGIAFQKAFNEEKLVTRDELFITGKLWNSDHDVDIVPKACNYSLNDLQIEYFDLYLIHFPIAWKHTGLESGSWGASELGDTPLIDTWRAMEKLVDSGKCRSIGVSNYPLMLLHDLVNQARIPVACNQIETHVYYQRESLVNYCLSRNICVVAHTPLGGGATNQQVWNTPNPLEDPVIQEIATTHTKKSPAQILLKFLLQRGIVILPKSIKIHRMEENINIFDFQLTTNEMEKLYTLDKYKSYKTNPNPLGAFLDGPDAFSKDGTDIFD